MNGKPAVDNPSNLWQPSGSAPDSLPNDLFGNVDAPAKPKVHASAAPRTASSFAQPQTHSTAAPTHTAAPAAPAAKPEVKAEEVKTEVNPFGTYTPQPQKKAEPLLLRRLNQKNFSPKPSIRSTRLSVARSQRLMPAVRRPERQHDFRQLPRQQQHPSCQRRVRNPESSAGNGNDSGLWTANQHNGAPEAKGQGAVEAKAEDENRVSNMASPLSCARRTKVWPHL